MSVRAQGTKACSKSEDSRPFAIDSINKILNIAKAIQSSDKKASQFCSALSGVLWTIKGQLQNQHQIQDEGQKVESLLNNLERLCNVSDVRSLAVDYLAIH